MDLYGTGASIGQANALSNEVRNANVGVETINSELAGKLDEKRNELDQEGIENQAINMYKGGQSLSSFVSNPQVVDAVGRLKTRGVKAAGKFLPVSGAERFERGGIEGLENVRDIRTADDVRQAAQALSEGEDELDASRFAAGAGAESTLDALPIGESGSTIGVPSEETVAQSIASDEQLTADVTDETGGVVREGAEAGEDVARGVSSSADIVKTTAKEALGTFARGAAAGIGGGLDIYKDISRGSIGDNWEQQVGNVGNIIGSGLEVAGLLTAWTGPLGIGLEALGAGLSVGSTALEAYGDVRAGEDKEKTEEGDVEQQKQQAVSAQTIEKAVGRTE